MRKTTSHPDAGAESRGSGARAAESAGPLFDTLASVGLIVAVYGMLVAMTVGYRVTLSALGG